MRGQIFTQPIALSGSGVAAAGFNALAVQNDDMPAAKLVAVIPFARIARCSAEVLEIVSGTGGMKFVIARSGPGAAFHASPGLVVQQNFPAVPSG